MAFFSIFGVDFGGSAGAAADLYLKPFQLPGLWLAVMMMAPRPSGGDPVADYRGGDGLGSRIDLDAVAGEDFGRGGGEVLGGETGIVADYQAALGQVLAFK